MSERAGCPDGFDGDAKGWNQTVEPANKLHLYMGGGKPSETNLHGSFPGPISTVEK